MQQRDDRIMRPRQAGRRGRELHQHNGATRETARQKYESYLARTREADVAGDAVEMENCYQHAEHYWRVMRAAETAP
jgi:Domain of unknown function (DUF4167)